ncbi:hypothetical protein [Halosimplex halobium]|uniref:hypothetical protein n=1 Tax=Halosimplex halobium TaxID=3396618 RepID=UPI003F56008B
MNRRQALIGIGSLAVGSGAALGSGAFTSVEADRTVTLQTAGDGSAYLQMDGDGEYVTTAGSDSTLGIDLGNVNQDDGFNKNAITKVAEVVTITNNSGDDSGITVGFGGPDSQTGSQTVTIGDGTDPVADVTFYINTNGGYDESTNTPTLSANGDKAHLDVKVDTSTVDGSSSSETATLTLSADTV